MIYVNHGNRRNHWVQQFSAVNFGFLIAAAFALMARVMATVSDGSPVGDLPTRGLEERSGRKLTQAEADAKLRVANITTASPGNCTDKYVAIHSFPL